MKDALINQFHHQWRILKATIDEFDDNSWMNTGHGLTTPTLTAYHILTAVRYYDRAKTVFHRADGSVLSGGRQDLENTMRPTRDELRTNIPAFEMDLDNWLKDLDFDAENTSFSYAGSTMGALVLFVLRHNEYHLGELNALLNETLDGKASDHFADTLK